MLFSPPFFRQNTPLFQKQQKTMRGRFEPRIAISSEIQWI